jgi:hypothetical protein
MKNRYRKISVVLVLIIFFVLLYCGKIKKQKKYYLTYYRNKSNFAGWYLELQKGEKAFYQRPVEAKYVVFWNREGLKGSFDTPHFPLFVKICPDTLEVMMVCTEGVLMVPPNGTSHYWIYKWDNVKLLSAYDTNKNNQELLLVGMDGRSGQYIPVLIVFDTFRNSEKKCEIGGYAREVGFIDKNTVIASVTKDFNREDYELIKVEFAEDGDHKVTPWPCPNKNAKLEAVYRNKPVFSYQEGDKFTLEFNDTNIQFSTPLEYVYATKSCIWGVDREINMFRADYDGTKMNLGSFVNENLIGCGTVNDKFWVAFSEGTVATFGIGNFKEITEIALP